jgi:hypothetical protein
VYSKNPEGPGQEAWTRAELARTTAASRGARLAIRKTVGRIPKAGVENLNRLYVEVVPGDDVESSSASVQRDADVAGGEWGFSEHPPLSVDHRDRESFRGRRLDPESPALIRDHRADHGE